MHWQVPKSLEWQIFSKQSNLCTPSFALLCSLSWRLWTWLCSSVFLWLRNMWPKWQEGAIVHLACWEQDISKTTKTAIVQLWEHPSIRPNCLSNSYAELWPGAESMVQFPMLPFKWGFNQMAVYLPAVLLRQRPLKRLQKPDIKIKVIYSYSWLWGTVEVTLTALGKLQKHIRDVKWQDERTQHPLQPAESSCEKNRR